ncbi:50S ribosomal protein L9 [Candidatus Poribacteria bacterium]|nr:50S ribosomal protein L9 [Candidatus Poribacteria bacterium]MYA69920.1 50S ribosomal protein L9 [Candidatus Poribacteria bacterium]MYH82088.1 50S ribosomal protein L9 [Candidatus Poribacteria bacterium]MYK96120.1 50S ribosomal protein L9 [Candidatus Poribacteria bacterium]
MEVILKKSVEGLGVPGDVLKVADGYARNYLLPMQLAVHATERNRRFLEHQKRVIDQQESKDKERAREIAAQITGVTCTLKRRAGENDRLFGSVTSMDVAEALRAEGFELERRFLELAEPIRELGVFMVPVKLHTDVVVELRVVVEREA